MSNNEVAHPPITSRDEWLVQRKALLEKEKELTRTYDRLNAERRRLPMVLVEKKYTFQTPEGPVSLLDLFEGQRQLIVYHFMFDPEWEKGCPGCTSWVDAVGSLADLADRQTAFTLVSRAPLEKLEAYKTERGWTQRWVSSYGSDFNYDFHVTQDVDVAPLEYNYVTGEDLIAKVGKVPKGEHPGLSVFFQLDGKVYHTYSTFQRGAEALVDSYRMLDVTPYGRQEDFEDSPPGWPQRPTYG